MEKQYEQFCLADPLFYDHPSHDRKRREIFTAASRALPAGWRNERVGDWMAAMPPTTEMTTEIPQQGWKIHISATLENSDDTITQAWDYCVSRGINFKFLPAKMSVLMHNAKYAPRGSSGKVVTIYPADETELERVLVELDELIGGAAGPYILSDLRYGDGPLYVRYGGFVERHCLDARGTLVPAIEDASGELVPDLRPPVFKVPSWVRLPGFLEPQLAARNSATIEDLPYRVEHALHFSNGGGVYEATDKRTGARVVLKEARPYAGLAADGSDAVDRLRREHEFLSRLSGLGIAPEPLGYFEVGGHHFLAEEFVEGVTLNSCYAGRYPLTGADPDPGRVASYTSWALRICASVEQAVTAMHERGVIFNDLHMFNIMIRPDDSIAFIDFEAASRVDEGRRLTVGNPGFVAPRDRAGRAVDTYSTACIRLAMFMPLTTLFALDRNKAASIAAVAAEQFPVPAAFLDDAVREITQSRTPGHRDPKPLSEHELSWDSVSEPLIRAILASATLDREDRLFPGDIEQFRRPGGGLGLANGAAGVLYALSETAGVRVPDYEEWLIARAAAPVRSTGLGLYDGLAGVAYTLSRLGHTEAARKTTDLCLGNHWERLGSDLLTGLPGFALAMLDLADSLDEPAAREAGFKIAAIVADRAGRQEQRGPAGLLRGASGRALLFLRLYERTGDPAYLDSAETAIRSDLSQCVTDEKGALQVDEGWRVLPYLNAGSAGIGMVTDLFLAHRQIDAFAEASAAIHIAARSAFYVQAGLFNGRAGMILYLASRDRQDSHVAAQVRRLAWHAVDYGDGLAFPGDMLLRLSMDLGTGTAGVLLSVGAALAPGRTPTLPFLGPPISLPGEQVVQGSIKEPVKVRR
ncbi:MAG: class III lanthionine synthetase LanKC [Streptosporangiaceae bacterium]